MKTTEAHNCHGKIKKLTAKSKSSRQIKKLRQEPKAHGKSQKLTARAKGLEVWVRLKRLQSIMGSFQNGGRTCVDFMYFVPAVYFSRCFASSCGNPVNDGDRYCAQCGQGEF